MLPRFFLGSIDHEKVYGEYFLYILYNIIQMYNKEQYDDIF